MSMIKVLNLYAGIGGNRKLWKGVKVDAIDNNPDVLEVYNDYFPKDVTYCEDAHEYLLNHFKDYDFIWSSPPCQSHSSFRKNICVRYRGTKPIYPDMRLWQEILFMQGHRDKPWVVENVKPYYKPLIQGKLIQRHMFWSNFKIDDLEFETDLIRKSQIPQLQEKTGFDLSSYKFKNKRQILRNCVRPEIGLHILNCIKNRDAIE